MSNAVNAVEHTDIPNEEMDLSEENATSTRVSKYAFLLSFAKHALLPFVIIRLALFLVGIVTVYYVEPLVNQHQPIALSSDASQFPGLFWSMWAKFDSGFYTDIAQNGYWGANTLHGMSNWAFFPFYPLLIHIVAFPIASHQHAYLFAGILISNVSAIIAIYYLYKLTTHDFNQRVASRAVLYLAIYPMSFFLSCVYPEAVFLVLTLSSFYYARTHRWWIAGILGGLASLTRPQGVLMLAVVGWEYWQVLADRYAPLEHQGEGIVAASQGWLRSRFLGLWISLRSLRTWLGFVALMLIPFGLALFAIYGKIKVGTFLAFQMAEHYGWNRSFTNPIIVLKYMYRHPLAPSPYEWNFYALNITAIVFFIAILILTFRKLPIIYSIFSLCFVLLPLSSGAPNSIARYYMEVFPAFILLAVLTFNKKGDDREWLHNLIVPTFSILLGLAMVLWTLGVYALA